MSTVCRVCLTGGGNVTLCSLEDVRLQDVFMKLTDTQFYSDGRPRVVCSSCYKNLLRCWTLSETARRSENTLSNLLFKGLEATPETIENLNVGTNLHLMQNNLDKETPKNSSAIIIKEEPISVKDEETVQVDGLDDTESADTVISEECIKNEMIFEEDSENKNSWIEINITKLNHETDTENLDSDQEQSQNQQTKKIDTAEKDTVCSICHKRFKKKYTLVRHMNIHTGVKPYACSICDKKYNQKCNLVMHMTVHTGKKPHACHICGKQFNCNSYLVSHVRTHTGEKPHACGICEKKFNEKSNLVRHMRTLH